MRATGPATGRAQVCAGFYCGTASLSVAGACVGANLVFALIPSRMMQGEHKVRPYKFARFSANYGGQTQGLPLQNMPSSSPIVVLDSGLGGLTVVRALRQELPHEDIIYFGDTARLPYGSKTAATVTRFVEQI